MSGGMKQLRTLRQLRDDGLLTEEEFSARKMPIIRGMLGNAASVVAELQADGETASVPQNDRKNAANHANVAPAVKKVLVPEKQPVLSRLSQNLRKGPAPEKMWEPGLLEERSLGLEAAREEEARILAWCAKNGCKWSDPGFVAERSSIARHNVRLLKNVDHWVRLTERSPNPSLFVGGSGSGDVIQGEVGDCWFLGALAMCATRQEDLLYPLFVSAHPEQGFFQIRFYVDAAWRVVTVDDRVPAKRLDSLIFAHCKNEDEYWVALVEKAFAKLLGCYENLGSGNFSEAMTNLTGEGSECFELTPQMAESDEMWNKLTYYVEEAFLMGCAIEGVGEHDNGRGLLTGHAYGIISCRETRRDGVRLLQLFNPWGMKEWTGAYSDGAPEWTPELTVELNQTEEDDGMFWMTYDDFLANFNMFSVCRLLTDDVGKIWQKRIFCGEWDADSSGGCCNYSSWTCNPQYWLVTSVETQMFFHLARQDTRVNGKANKFTEAIGCYVFVERDLTRRKMHRYQNDLFLNHQPLFISAREYSWSALVPPGNYVLVPCTFDPKQSARFFLSVYSEDPVECGEMGYGSAAPAPIVRLDTRLIAALNRPDADDAAPPEPKPVERPAAAPAPAAAADAVCCVCSKTTKGGGKCFRMNGQRYHVACFRCHACQTPLDPRNFFQDADGQAVCEECQ